jgi:large subunit ribosomal protein L13
MKTYVAKKEEVKRDWWLVDASDIPLGRLASQVAKLLMGKHKPIYTPHVDTGDFVIVVNARKIKLTGKKAEEKFYYRHTGYLGHLKKIPYGRLREERPDLMVKLAVKGMLPKNRLGRKMLKKLKVYAGSEHPHQPQKPKVWEWIK